MTHSRLSGLVMAGLLLMAPSVQANLETLCSGFLPENDMQIPVTAFQAGGITEAEFHAVMDQAQAVYGPIIAAKGGTFRINRNWSDSTVNASAQRQGSIYIINMYGGLARHPSMTKDGFMLVVCHEIGHHLGGAPKIEGWFGNNWATNEGGSDYFATLRCMRKMFSDDENAVFVTENEIDPYAKQKCEEVYSTQAEENLCMRMATAGMVGGMLFKDLHKDANPPKFETPDPRVVNRTDHSHPATQCRLDTYFQGALCFHDGNIELSDSDPNTGTCSTANGQSIGLRPLCWFKP